MSDAVLCLLVLALVVGLFVWNRLPVELVALGSAVLLYATGLRVSELCGLGINDVQLGAGYLVAKGKGSKERVVPVGSKAVEKVQEYLAGTRQIDIPARRLIDSELAPA